MVWKNWSGSVVCHPRHPRSPQSEEAVIQCVRDARRERSKIRPVGSGHSFVPLCASEDMMVSLEKLTGLVSVDVPHQTATVKAGTCLHDLGPALAEHGLAMENLGDIDVQSLAGALNTGTHGTGHNFGVLATQIEELTLVNGRGEMHTCSAQQNSDLFHAARVSLGALGVITQYKLRLKPSYRLHYQSRRGTLNEALVQMGNWREQHRNFEFYWFPHTNSVQLKFSDLSEQQPKGNGLGKKLNDLLLENGAFWLISQLARFVPSLCPKISRLCGALVGEASLIDESYKVYATQRHVRFQEMEYNIPLEELEDVLLKIQALIQDRRVKVHFPLECRFSAGDDIWLSPAYERPSAYIAVHMFKGMPYLEYFKAVEAILLDHGGRPHWGKWHSLDAVRLAQRYPRWSDFQRVRQQMDPEGIFQTGYLEKVLGN